MNKPAALALSAATLALVVNGGSALASGGSSSSSGTWPTTTYPTTSPSTIVSQSSSRVSFRSTDTVSTVMSKLDAIYVGQKGCSRHVAVNKPVDYFCTNPATHKTDEVYFTFAALDPKPTDPSRSQTNGFLLKG